MTINYCYDENAKRRVASRFKSQLRKVAEAMGLDKSEYDLRFNPGGIAVWGEVTLHCEHVYIQASHGCDLGVLVRACEGRKDYTGRQNCWIDFQTLRNDPVGFAHRVESIARKWVRS